MKLRVPRVFLLRVFITIIFGTNASLGAIPTPKSPEPTSSLKQRIEAKIKSQKVSPSSSLIFDLPVTYNKSVAMWIHYFQGRGGKWFREWLERANRYMPVITQELKNAGLPQDLGYMVMIESGFSPFAISHADAVGPWQFIQATGQRYGLRTYWWLDERRDLQKSTHAAIRFIRDLYKEFGSWYLVAASYNMGENGLRRIIQKNQTKDYWKLVQLHALPIETQQYVPKILAAMLISKAPNLYGFRNLSLQTPFDYEQALVPGGVELDVLADHLGVTKKFLKDLNAELVHGYVPKTIASHMIRVPKGSRSLLQSYLTKLGPQVAME